MKARKKYMRILFTQEEEDALKVERDKVAKTIPLAKYAREKLLNKWK